MPTALPSQFVCDICAVRHHAEQHPATLKASLWRLHTRVCPMHRSYRALSGAPLPEPPPGVSDEATLFKLVGVVAAALVVIGLLLRRGGD
jgi:hypothetical protein